MLPNLAFTPNEAHIANSFSDPAQLFGEKSLGKINNRSGSVDTLKLKLVNEASSSNASTNCKQTYYSPTEVTTGTRVLSTKKETSSRGIENIYKG